MLAELRMKLEIDKPGFSYYQSSNMQGVLMQMIDGSYADYLHRQGLNPYSQYIVSGEENEWVVKTLTQEAFHSIIQPLLEETFTGFTIEKKDIHVKISKKTLKTIEKQELLDRFYQNEYHRYIELEFLTPTAFKSNGRYVILPDVRYIFQSLMNKYGASSSDMEMYDEETLEQLVQNSSIIRYKLKSVYFPMEGIKIPSFKGELSIKVNGTATMAKYAQLLTDFGEYSGIGIKTAMGMGGIRRKPSCDHGFSR